jgi:hypothetical protein
VTLTQLPGTDPDRITAFIVMLSRPKHCEILSVLPDTTQRLGFTRLRLAALSSQYESVSGMWVSYLLGLKETVRIDRQLYSQGIELIFRSHAAKQFSYHGKGDEQRATQSSRRTDSTPCRRSSLDYLRTRRGPWTALLLPTASAASAAPTSLRPRSRLLFGQTS